MDYAPFKPWFKYYSNSTRQTCWNTISCSLTQSDEARKQQYAAIALIMGLIPLFLKDVSWPERHAIPLSAPLPKIIEILVRTLSLEPEYTPPPPSSESEAGQNAARVQAWWRQRSIARWAWGIKNGRSSSSSNIVRSGRTSALLALLAFALAVCYTALGLIETYSKRAVLGCPYPIFVLSWHLLALLPAALHTAAAAWRAPRQSDAAAEPAMVPLVEMDPATAAASGGVTGQRQATKIAPNVVGLIASRGQQTAAAPETEEWWITQLIWALYYIIGTLIYTSISTVTVIELFVWVVVSFATTAFGRLLAFSLCMVYEARSRNA
ncbi:hypothetical protein DIS24_g11469 [Lasiodiplodia hormozganensis]|uniref:Uncharacterized protein n=1 Tax=Lasiodiplodia hormozganensis TaxID=869390 RepID=A0AA40C137_9PEZI|nr:hypothetical protein DIS24_g11469 [Lasiodiplodia hormozganensis]